MLDDIEDHASQARRAVAEIILERLTRITAAATTAHGTAKAMSGALAVTILRKHDFYAERWHTCFLHLVLRSRIQFLLASILSSAPQLP